MPGADQQIRVGREEEGTNSNRPELAGVVLALRQAELTDDVLILCDNESVLMMMLVYWYLFSNHYTLECIHICEEERNASPLKGPRALCMPPPRGVSMHRMLTT